MAPSEAQVPEGLHGKEGKTRFNIPNRHYKTQKFKKKLRDIYIYMCTCVCACVKDVFFREQELVLGSLTCLHQVAARIYMTNRGGSCPLVLFEK